jgi:hypothetical protein
VVQAGASVLRGRLRQGFGTALRGNRSESPVNRPLWVKRSDESSCRVFVIAANQQANVVGRRTAITRDR